MAIDLRLPKISSPTAEGQLQQLSSYLYQLVGDLNWALNSVQAAEQGDYSAVVYEAAKQAISDLSPQDTFDSIKALIIKSADIVEAYQEKMQLDFDGIYTAQSDFGNYQEVTNQQLTLQSNMIEQNYTQIELIDEQLRNTNAWIRTGELDSGVFGMEVGEHTTVGGVETYNKYARFTANGIYFYLPEVSEAVAWMTGNKLYITNAQITNSLNLGGYDIAVDQNGGINFRWVGLGGQ